MSNLLLLLACYLLYANGINCMQDEECLFDVFE